MTSLIKIQLNRSAVMARDYSADFGCLTRVVLLNLIKQQI